MPRFLRSKVFVLIVITIVIFTIMGITASRNSNSFLGNIISVPLAPVQKFFSLTAQKIDSFFLFLKDINDLKKENEDLKVRVAQLEKENGELQVYSEKNKELRDALQLKGQFDSYDLIGGNVIAKDPGNWFNIFKIDIGKKEGIIEGQTVITSSNSLVGRVLNSDYTTANIIAIIDEDSVVSGWISKPGGGHVIIRGDINLKDRGLCRMDYIPLDVDVTINDVIETSGLGGIYPKGILIGKVKEVRNVDDELNRYAVIEPAVNLKKLEEVFVLKNR